MKIFLVVAILAASVGLANAQVIPPSGGGGGTVTDVAIVGGTTSTNGTRVTLTPGAGGGDVFVSSNNVFATTTPITMTNVNARLQWVGAGWTNYFYATSSNFTFVVNGTNMYLQP